MHHAFLHYCRAGPSATGLGMDPQPEHGALLTTGLWSALCRVRGDACSPLLVLGPWELEAPFPFAGIRGFGELQSWEQYQVLHVHGLSYAEVLPVANSS